MAHHITVGESDECESFGALAGGDVLHRMRAESRQIGQRTDWSPAIGRPEGAPSLLAIAICCRKGLLE